MGNVAQVATQDGRRTGALRGAATKRERNRSFRAKLAAAVDAELESMLASFRDAWLAGDWRAAQALMHEAYGLPLQRTEGDTTVSIVVQSVLDDDDGELELPIVEARAAAVLPAGEDGIGEPLV